MTARRSLQEWIHWLEAGAGGRWVTRAAVILGVVLLSLRIGYTQFHGPLTEHTLAQAVVGRQRVGGPGEGARATLFLASDEASYLAGAEIAVDGGMLTGQYYVQFPGARGVD